MTKNLLENNYEISYFSADGKYIAKDDIETILQHGEWDTCWKLKKNT